MGSDAAIELLYDNLVRQLAEALEDANKIAGVAPSRPLSLAITKIDEALMWAQRADLQRSGAR